MAKTPKGHVESASEKEVTPPGNLDKGTEGRTVALSHVGVEQLKAQNRRSTRPDNSLFGNTRWWIGRSNAATTVGTHAP